jgi:hypothetical protein
MSNTYTHKYNRNHPIIEEYNESLAKQVEKEYYRDADKEAKQKGIGATLFILGFVLYLIFVSMPHQDRVQPPVGQIAGGVSEVR